MFLRRRKKYRLGIALSGGGARGFAHLGILKALKEKGVEPDIISGTSAGAIVGAFIASGKSPDETFEIIKEYRFFDLTKIRLPRMGLFNLDGLQNSINKEISEKRIEDLPMPMIIAATNMLEGKIDYFSNGPLAKCVQASSSIPILFSPVKIDGKMYLDGGIMDNLPIKPLTEVCRKTIAINISPLLPVHSIKNLAQVATRMLQLSINAREDTKTQQVDLFIEPQILDEYETLDTKHAKEIFDAGYKYASKLKISL